MTRICLINAHPDPAPERFCFALADAYQSAAEQAGHAVSRFNAGEIEVPLLESAEAFKAPPPAALAPIRDALSAADHLVLIYPLWLGSLPAKAKALLEQIARAGFLLDTGGDSSKWPAQKMKGKSARIIVTMGMPGFAYRLFYGSHSLKGLEAGVLKISGFKPVRDTVFGGVEMGPDARAKMLETAAKLGAKAV
jgi:putative NADPH-quinone reductase